MFHNHTFGLDKISAHKHNFGLPKWTLVQIYWYMLFIWTIQNRSKITVHNHNLGRSKITVPNWNFGQSKITVPNSYFVQSKITVHNCNSGQSKIRFHNCTFQWFKLQPTTVILDSPIRRWSKFTDICRPFGRLKNNIKTKIKKVQNHGPQL